MNTHVYEDPNRLSFIQSRAATNYDLVDEYVEMMEAGVQFEAAQGVRDESDQVYVWDGLHRGEAAKRVGKLLLVNIEPGSKQDAEWLALTANQKHGLRRSRADLQRIVRLALLHPKGVGLSDREIARHCGASDKTVGKIRSELEASAEIPQIHKRLVTRNGHTYTIDISNIGQVKSVPQPGGSFAHTPELSETHNSLEQNWSQAHEANFRETRIKPEYESGSTDHKPKALEFECPRCGRESIVGVNGSRRWCLNCSAEWLTVASFLAELQSLPTSVHSTREQLVSRFESILAKLSEVEQLGKIEVWLNDLEGELLIEKEME
jgi:hypothetical protein